MWSRQLSRRQLLALGGSTLAASIFGGTQAQSLGGEPTRVGVVLPTKTGITPIRPDTAALAGEAARKGAVMGKEEVGSDTRLMGRHLDVLISSAPSEEAAFRAAERLAGTEEVFALVGGFGDQALALSEVAAKCKILFFNIGSPSDALRGQACCRHSFHVEASAAMYLDALAGWFVRSGFHRWFFVHTNTDEGEALYQRARQTFNDRYSAATEVGRAVVPDAPLYGEALEAIRRAEPQLVLLLMDWRAQLDFMGAYEAAGLEPQLTGFPYPVTQTREFFIASREAAPRANVGRRVALWEAQLNAHSAWKLNSHFLGRWGVPMDPPAWAAYAAVKMLYEIVASTGTIKAPTLVDYLESAEADFNIYKGAGVSFRSWNHQLRQPLYLVDIDPEVNWGFKASKRIELASLTEELPNPDLVDANPIERLDRLGDGPKESHCDF